MTATSRPRTSLKEKQTASGRRPSTSKHTHLCFSHHPTSFRCSRILSGAPLSYSDEQRDEDESETNWATPWKWSIHQNLFVGFWRVVPVTKHHCSNPLFRGTKGFSRKRRINHELLEENGFQRTSDKILRSSFHVIVISAMMSPREEISHSFVKTARDGQLERF